METSGGITTSSKQLKSKKVTVTFLDFLFYKTIQTRTSCILLYPDKVLDGFL